MHFTLRPIVDSDLPALVQHANNTNITQYMTDKFPHPYTEESGKAFIEYAKTTNSSTIFAIDIEGKFCGAIGIHLQQDVHQKNAELGFWIAEPFWGKGIATNVLKQTIEIAFANPNIHRLFARVFSPNIGSKKIVEKAGFTLEGVLKESIYKNNQFLDEYIYALRR